MKIERLDGSLAEASYVKHLRTLSHRLRSMDVDLFRLEDGTEISCMSPECDSRVTPREVEEDAEYYPGFPIGA